MKYLRYLITSITVILIFGGYFYYLIISGQVEENPVSDAIFSVVRPYPELTDPKEITLSCDYHGEVIAVNETLYGSLYNYYRSDPAKKGAYLRNENEKFVFSYDKDETINKLSETIASQGKEEGLTNDQTLDLAICLLQGIPYDDAKAQRILGPGFASEPIEAVVPRYPYETLYDNLGICTDKTYLGAAVLGKLGYKTAILTFDSQKHMSLGVAVPDGYGSFKTGYGIAELTGSGFLVGDVPEIKANAGLAINSFETIDSDSEEKIEAGLELSAPSSVIAIGEGAIYERIVERMAVKLKLEELRPKLEASELEYLSAKAALEVSESTLQIAENTYNANPTQRNYNEYLDAYNRYLPVYNKAQASVESYNQNVNNYNYYVNLYRQY